MNILFVKGTSPLSAAIVGITDEPVSHVALEFPELGIVVHSNLLGVNIEWSTFFRKNCQVIYTLTDNSNDMAADKQKLGLTLDQYEGKFYDFGALLFDGMCLLAKRYLKIPLPKTNLWASSGMFMCTEWAEEYIDMKNDAMITPYGLYIKLKQSKKWVDAT